MLTGAPILSIITFAPLAGAAFILLIRAMARSEDDPMIARNARWLALFVTGFVFVATVMLVVDFDAASPGYQFVEQARWLGGGINYRMGVDGISILFVLLTAFLMPLCVLASWTSIEERAAEYMIAFLLLETLMIGVFCALDLVLFYLFFEGGLIPMFIIIGVWGGKNRVYAAFKFFLYTLLGSVLMLVAIIAMYLYSGTVLPDGATMDIEALSGIAFPADMQFWLWLAFFASFAVKMPMWPVHTWLPDAHVEAPTAGSVILAGVLLKMGGYGFLRFSLPMFPEASQFFAPMVFALSVIAIIYTSLVAFRQVDIKKLIAYSSVAHMGFVTMGIFTFNEQGIQGAIFQMLSHGVISGALFLCVGVIYDRMHTREIAFYGGLVNRMPLYAMVFMLFTMGNVGLPGTSGFVGELLTMAGAYQASSWVAVGAATGVIFSAVYALTLYKRVVFGEISNMKLERIEDMVARESLIFLPLVLATLALGVFPTLVTDLTASSVEALLAHVAEAP
jgi:NADH-quinone oxidoreductase subunit M